MARMPSGFLHLIHALDFESVKLEVTVKMGSNYLVLLVILAIKLVLIRVNVVVSARLASSVPQAPQIANQISVATPACIVL